MTGPKHATQFPELSYQRFGHHWRVIDNQTGNCIGPVYPSERTLLADLVRFASVYGCNA
jgi:hypothetical protein